MQELVPVFLDTVPIDPYDGKHIRYNPAAGIVYCVGTNLTDDGGSTVIPGGESDGDCNDYRDTEDIVYSVVESMMASN